MSGATADLLDPVNAFRPAEEGPDDPRPIIERLVAVCPEFEDIRVGEAAIMVLFRTEEKIKNQEMILGEMCLPRWQGNLASLASWLLVKACGGAMPDFIMILDAAFWERASPEQREALVHHELKHCHHARDKEGELRFTDEGLPVWAIIGHDVEEFYDTVRRFGDWAGDVTPLVDALKNGAGRR